MPLLSAAICAADKGSILYPFDNERSTELVFRIYSTKPVERNASELTGESSGRNLRTSYILLVRPSNFFLMLQGSNSNTVSFIFWNILVITLG